ncbi:hypothetical protein AB1Y20_001799 [Prymnesium parvum]|uniref:Cation-transporting P-type ATPase C-terminal domain-containing protein n=1 Tax=Prymnesium parvum TaxID=97485 RepID=A0AB34KCR9_PRYPA
MELPLEQQHQLLALSLTQRQAKQTLLDSVSLQLQRERRRHTKRRRTWRLLLAYTEPSALCASLSGALLLLCAAGCGGPFAADGPTTWNVAPGPVGVVLLVLGFVNAWISAREAHLASIESLRAVELWLSRVALQNSLFRGLTRTSSSRVFQVMRDGAWISLHRNLLVQGDVIMLQHGDAAPAAATSALPQPNGERYSLAAGAIFAPPASPVGGHAAGSAFVLHDDVAATIVAALFGRQTAISSSRRPRNPTPLSKQVRAAMTRLLLPVALLLTALSAAQQVIELIVHTHEGLSASQLYAWLSHHFVPHAVLLWLPLLPVALPMFVAVAEAYAASHLLATLTGMPLPDGGDMAGSSSAATPPSGAAGGAEGGSGCGHAALASEQSVWSWLYSAVRGDAAAARRYQRQWDITTRFESGEASKAGLLGKRGAEHALSTRMTNVVPGTRFVNEAGSSFTRAQCRYLAECAWHALRADATAVEMGLLLRSSSLLQTLGSTTVLAFPDKHGILSDGAPSIKQLLFFRTEAGMSKLMALDMSKDPSSRLLFRFDQPGWRKHLPSLKPFGLNCLFIASCRHADNGAALKCKLQARLLHLGVRSPLPEGPVHGCLCLLAREIGFTDDVLSRFTRRVEVHVIGSRVGPKEHSLPILSSVIVEDEDGQLQMFTRGQPAMVIGRCSTLWDGSAIRPLTPEERRQLRSATSSIAGKRCLDCSAFSYAPVPPELEWLFENANGEVQQDIILDDDKQNSYADDEGMVRTSDTMSGGDFAAEGSAAADEMSARCSCCNPAELHFEAGVVDSPRARGSVDSPKRQRDASLESPLLRRSGSEAADQASRRQAAFRKLLRGQVFIGLAGAVDRARVEAPDMVEDIVNAGVRFVHLSREDVRRTKAFGYELGVETDWNSCIDLGEREEEDQEAAAPLEKLPRGIDAVRPHLRDVDNVPLLVSLFCRCSRESVEEMVRIYQENAEVVTIVGSTDNPENVGIFGQADIALALRPLPRWRCRWLGLDQPRVQKREGHTVTSKSQSSNLPVLLDSLGCVAVLPEGQDIELITDWLLQGRSLQSNMRQGLSFGLFASLLMAMTGAIVDAMGKPPAFTPLQILWLLLIPPPLLAFSLLLTPIDPKNKKEMVPKADEHLDGASYFALYLLLRALPGAIATSAIYALLLRPFEGLQRPTIPDSNDLTKIINAIVSEVTTKAATPPSPPPLTPQWVPPPSSALNELCWLPPYLRRGAANDHDHEFARIAAQHVLSLWIVVLLILHSAKFAHRTLDGSDYDPRRNNSAWVVASITVAALQTVHCMISLGSNTFFEALALTPWYVYLIALLSLLSANVIDSLVKKHDRKRFERRNRSLYLEFTTKLGMHSPIEPGWKTPKSFLDEEQG